MPEACFLCLDSSEFMRNGDQSPNRFIAVREAANLLAAAKMEANAENTVGFLTLGGNACTVYETLTRDVDRVMTTLTKTSIGGRQCHFSKGLLVACLALGHRTNPRAEKRIIAFVGTPLSEEDIELEKLAGRIRKENVAVDIVSVGVEKNAPRLEKFIDRVNSNGKSHFLRVPAKTSLIDCLMSSPIMMEFNDVGGMEGASQGFNIDPTADPELEMVLRMSLEEENQRRMAAASNQTSEGNAPGNIAPLSEGALRNLSEEEQLEHALRMSLEENRKTTAAASNGASEANVTGNIAPLSEGALRNLSEEEQLEHALRMSLEACAAQNAGQLENTETSLSAGDNFERELQMQLERLTNEQEHAQNEEEEQNQTQDPQNDVDKTDAEYRK
uniref:Putative proteasome regulatory non-ATP-ase subunit 10 n=1 Tax=Trypanosoma congolense (strain IL3000) TaxID=1068625 RepID=G0UQZ3_TRYCI|nr:putative proteasome regulatory non-ATP-ase subunit 10 [Trypanosoma congolense IL3000]